MIDNAGSYDGLRICLALVEAILLDHLVQSKPERCQHRTRRLHDPTCLLQELAGRGRLALGIEGHLLTDKNALAALQADGSGQSHWPLPGVVERSIRAG